jgi:hypothetical protein
MREGGYSWTAIRTEISTSPMRQRARFFSAFDQWKKERILAGDDPE